MTYSINANYNILNLNYTKTQQKKQSETEVQDNNHPTTSENKNIAFYGFDLVKKKEIPPILSEMFEAIKDKKDEELAETAYPYLVKYIGVEDVAPPKITWEKTEGRPIVADYKVFENSIVIYSDLFKKVSKAEQLAFIAHELTHCKQSFNMMRTENIGIEKYAYANAVSDFRAATIRNKNIINALIEAKRNNKEKELIQYLIQKSTINNIKELKQTYPNFDKLSKIKSTSIEGQKAQTDLKAQFEYNGADINAYNNCPLEKEAIEKENEIIKIYKQSIYL